MKSPEHERLDLRQAFEQALGGERIARIAMEALPPIDYDQLATKTDLALLETTLDAKFDKVDARFDKVDARFDQVDARFDQVDARIEKVDAKFDNVDARFDKMDAMFDNVDARFDSLNGELQLSMAHLLRTVILMQLATFAGTIAFIARFG